MEDLHSLKRQRAAVKSKLTIFKNFLSTVTQSNLPLDDTAEIELEERVAKFQKTLDEFEGIQSQIDALVEDIDAEFIQRQEFDKIYFSTLAAAKKLVSDSAKTKLPENGSPSSASSTASDRQLNTIKLPTIELPKFNGKYECWLEFRDTFQSLIHENESINNVQRFHYLRSSLIGNALNVIQSLEFTAVNYAIAWDILCKRFNNFRLLVHNHVKAFFNLDLISKESSSKIRKLIDAVLKHLRALKLLKQPVEHWDTLIIHLITTKLDKVTLREWEQYKADKEIPTLEEHLHFLRSRADLLETLELGHSDRAVENKGKINARALIAVQNHCVGCAGEHETRDCKEFLTLSVNERFAKAQGGKLCLNCLRRGHFSRFCRASSCKKCRGRHHTLLHQEKPTSSSTSVESAAPVPAVNNPSVALSGNISGSQVILSTAIIIVYDAQNQPQRIRALLDCGSQSSFITVRVWQMLKLKLEKAKLAVSGLTQLMSHSENKCTVKICCNRGSFISNLSCFLLPRITGDLPNFRFDSTTIEIPNNITLADPDFNVPGPIDILIGADLFWSLISVGRVILGPNKPILQKSKLGWLVCGPIGSNISNKVVCNVSTDLEQQVSQFWQLEEFPDVPPRSKEELACESSFVQNTKRNVDGRFIVKIPLKGSVSLLGNSLKQAERRFRHLERRLDTDLNLKAQYSAFMAEYESLGHMVKVKGPFSPSESAYYMPHHPVIRENSLTTKLRVVFDGSARSDSGYSMNDLQMVGPVIQNDLFSILLRFRKHAFVASSDIEKMYRQILVEPEQRSLQQILWRSDSHARLETYQLNTVTYGTACASFLAIRCLFQLAQECQSTLPKIAQIIKQDFYADDLLTGADTVEELTAICGQISKTLQGGCFRLRKWVSNDYRCLNEVSDSSNFGIIRELASNENGNKTLGLFWVPEDDKLLYQIDVSCENYIVTKRSILSTIAQIFDPLGLLSPCIVTAKILLQQLWQENLSWDQSVPQHLHSKWLKFRDELPALNTLRISRQGICKSPVRIELHGFSDASEHAYGGCIYLRSINSDGKVFVHLLCSKSKVAPLKITTIPRLELCASLLLSRLVNKVKGSLSIKINACFLWSDSMIVLGWLQTSSNLLKTFVANRVSEIQDLTDINDWRHVPTKENVADFVSRGVSPKQLQSLRMWWHGPNFLEMDESSWPTQISSVCDLPEWRQSLISAFSPSFDISAFSNLTRLEHVVAYCLRFINNCRVESRHRQIGPLTATELNESHMKLVRIAQSESFQRELSHLERDKPVSQKSKLLSLKPFLDEQGVIRVGGRLSNSDFNYNKKHPIILDGHSHMAKLLLKREHKRLMHAGPQLLLASIRDRFWPIAGKNAAKKVVHECIPCFKAKPRIVHPLMGDLPNKRTSATFPFSTVGVDYAGPFSVRSRTGRGSKTSKCYLSLFVCFSTKAVHLELVTDLTKNAFILALRRFVSRRGKPINLYSDNGTNFVGANNELKALGEFLQTNSEQVTTDLLKEGIIWHFIPPHSPHFGGLWESGIKSAKYHLKRVVGNSSLTFEQLYTVCVQIEAILNSRPLSPLSSNPDDPLPITPAHFLIGRALTALPDPDLRQLQENRLTHFQRLQQITQNFWSRWSKEFVSQLQQRRKWRTVVPNIKEGDLVVVKEQDLPPMKWLLGRVVQVHAGPDSVVRVVTVQTPNGKVKRAVAKVGVLPIEQ